MAMSSAVLHSTERVGRDTETELVVKVSLDSFKDMAIDRVIWIMC